MSDEKRLGEIRAQYNVVSEQVGAGLRDTVSVDAYLQSVRWLLDEVTRLERADAALKHIENQLRQKSRGGVAVNRLPDPGGDFTVAEKAIARIVIDYWREDDSAEKGE